MILSAALAAGNMCVQSSFNFHICASSSIQWSPLMNSYQSIACEFISRGISIVPYCTHVQGFNFRSVVLLEICLDEKSISKRSPTQPPTQLAQFDISVMKTRQANSFPLISDKVITKTQCLNFFEHSVQTDKYTETNAEFNDMPTATVSLIIVKVQKITIWHYLLVSGQSSRLRSFKSCLRFISCR